MQCAAKAIEFAEIAQNNDHYAIQGHSRSLILVPIESPYTISYCIRLFVTRTEYSKDPNKNRQTYDFLLLINPNLPPILHRFRDIAVDSSKIAILCYPSCFPPAE